ncbi:MAG: cytochrome C oxidase subunit IV family protein [Fimbriimonas sp.]
MASTPLAKAHDHGHHVHSLWMYIGTFLALAFFMALTIVMSFWSAPNVGPISGAVVNNAIALAIASVKAYIVVAYFMHTKWATSLTKLWAIFGFVWFFLLFIICGDYATRQYEEVQGWEPVKDTAMPRTPEFKSEQETDKNRINLKSRF